MDLTLLFKAIAQANTDARLHSLYNQAKKSGKLSDDEMEQVKNRCVARQACLAFDVYEPDPVPRPPAPEPRKRLVMKI